MSSITYKHTKFWMIATSHARDALVTSSKIKSISSINKIRWNWYKQQQLKRTLKQYEKCSQSVDIIISMCAFCLEAFINFYAIHYELDKKPSYREKIPSIKKWEKYPQLTVGVKPSLSFLNRIQKLMNDRNRIAHYIPIDSSSSYTEFNLADALTNLNELSQLFDEFHSIDPRIKFPHFIIDIPDYAKNISLTYNAVCSCP